MNQMVSVVCSLQSVEPTILKGSVLQSCSIPRINSGPLDISFLCDTDAAYALLK